MNVNSIPPSERGQTLLIVVLVMVIALTVGLSVVSRSITNLRISTEEASSQRAFSAAEAGVEQVLKSRQEITGPQQLSADATIQEVTIDPIAGTDFLLNGGSPIPKDDGTDVWLSDYSADPSLIYRNPWTGNISFNWGASGEVCDPNPLQNTQAALEIVVISGTKAAPTSTRYAFDPCSSRAVYNNFQDPEAGETIGGKTFAYKATISITSGLIARVIPLYASAAVGISGGGSALPSQGDIISSTGTSESTTRKITFFQGYPEIPSEFFPYVLFSPR